ncbi:GIY-YIG nuclease family protein [Draconibacterium sp.]|uniref:GIY-YIG nuclease family protein n=1 Tax=Draconibacterium sp. TaxID=1965318 RepID=UPI0035653F12
MENFFDKYYWVYVLLSESDGKKYTGYTKNLPSRFEAHQNGEVQSTKHRRPFKLIYCEACLSKEDGLKREKHLKTHYGKMFLGNRLKSYFTGQEQRKDINPSQ